MNKLIEIPRLENWKLQYKDSANFYVLPEDDPEGLDITRVHAHERLWEFASNQVISFDIAGNNGLIGGHKIENDNFYLLWLILNEAATQPLGFGLTKRPDEEATAKTNGNKGTAAIFTIPNSYSFTIGARVSCVSDDTVGSEDWNCGTVIDVSATTITVRMDNETWGTNLTSTTPQITQWNKYRPKILTTNTNYSNRFKLLTSTRLYINSSGDLQLVYDHGGGLDCPIWWDRDRPSPIHILHPYYKILDGTVITNPLSPFLDAATRDFITDESFIRARVSSGLTQAGTIIPSVQMSAASDRLYYPDANVSPSQYDSAAGAVTANYVAKAGADGTLIQYYVVRPVNISMIPIVRIV